MNILFERVLLFYLHKELTIWRKILTITTFKTMLNTINRFNLFIPTIVVRLSKKQIFEKFLQTRLLAGLQVFL